MSERKVDCPFVCASPKNPLRCMIRGVAACEWPCRLAQQGGDCPYFEAIQGWADRRTEVKIEELREEGRQCRVARRSTYTSLVPIRGRRDNMLSSLILKNGLRDNERVTLVIIRGEEEK